MLNLLKSNDIKESIVCGVITQIALLEVLKHVGVEPSYTNGCSYGEFANGYVRGDLTMEQAIVLAYCVRLRLICKTKVETKEKYYLILILICIRCFLGNRRYMRSN